MDSVEFIDLSNLPTYTPTWETNNTIELYGYTITLPDVPDDEYCVNNQFKKEDQYYRFHTQSGCVLYILKRLSRKFCIWCNT